MKQLGEAVSGPEHRVEQVLRRLIDQDASIERFTYRRLALGITNFNWLAESKDSKLFVKIYGDGTGAYIDRAVSAEASRIVGDRRVGPRQRYLFEDVGAEIYDFLEGFSQCTLEKFLHPPVRANVLRSIRKVHDGPRISFTRTGFEQMNERIERMRRQAPHLPADIDMLIWQCRRAEAAIDAVGMDLVLSHNDLYFANIMVDDDDEARIIDWEYASNNDRAWDLANMSMVSGGDDVSPLVRDYGSENAETFAARIRLYRVVILVSWGIWAALQAQESSIAYDYRRHSMLLLQMARHKLRQPDWEAALRTV